MTVNYVLKTYVNAIIACQLLVAPDNGMINCSLGDDGQASLGDTCTVTCNSGYELSGNTSRSVRLMETGVVLSQHAHKVCYQDTQ